MDSYTAAQNLEDTEEWQAICWSVSVDRGITMWQIIWQAVKGNISFAKNQILKAAWVYFRHISNQIRATLQIKSIAFLDKHTALQPVISQNSKWVREALKLLNAVAIYRSVFQRPQVQQYLLLTFSWLVKLQAFNMMLLSLMCTSGQSKLTE